MPDILKEVKHNLRNKIDLPAEFEPRFDLEQPDNTHLEKRSKAGFKKFFKGRHKVLKMYLLILSAVHYECVLIHAGCIRRW